MDAFSLQNCRNSLWRRFNKMLETFHADMTASQLLHICCDVNHELITIFFQI